LLKHSCYPAPIQLRNLLQCYILVSFELLMYIYKKSQKKFIAAALIFWSASIAAQVPPKSGNNGGSGNTGSGREEEMISDVPVPDMEMRPRLTIFSGDDKKYGVKKNGVVLFPAVYDQVSFLPNNNLLLQKKQQWGVANNEGTLLLPTEYDSIAYSYNEAAFTVFKNKKATAFDQTGKPLLPAAYDQVLYVSAVNHYACVVKNGDTLLLYDNNRIPGPFSFLGFYNNLVIAKKNNRYGALSRGKELMAFEYDSIYSTHAGNNRKVVYKHPYNFNMPVPVLMVMQRNKYGLADAANGLVVPVVNDKITYDHLRHIYYVQKDQLQGLYFEQFREATPVEYESIYTDGAQYITVKKNGKYGIIDYQNKQVVPCEYEKIDILGFNTHFRVKQQGKTGLLTNKGKIVLPVLYDDIDNFGFEEKLSGFYKVSRDKKFGMVNSSNEVVIPLQFDGLYSWGNFLMVNTGDKRGLYSREGKEICAAEYNWFNRSATQKSELLFSEKDSLTGVIKGDGTILYPPTFKKLGYITNADGLLNPFSPNKGRYLFVQDQKNKFGIFEELSAQMVIPVVYDSVEQKFETDSATFFAMRKNKKYGVVTGSGRTVIPFMYDSISVDKINTAGSNAPVQIVAKKGTQWGVVDIDNHIIVPFLYDRLVKLSPDNFYKAGKKERYSIINGKNMVVRAGPFDEVANYEEDQALTFYKGNMRVIDKTGRWITTALPMQPHRGYATFDALKQALIEALNSNDDMLLKNVAENIAPSEHLLYFIKENVFNKKPLDYTDISAVRQKYYLDLLSFKRNQWNSNHYSKKSLTEVTDYTLEEEHGFISNKRNEDHAFGDTRFVEKLLRNAIKVNGYWLSTYFMHRNFYR